MIFEIKFYVKNEKSTLKYGKILSKMIFQKNIYFLIGELGIGKTKIIKKIIGTKIKYKKYIKSPTYKLIEFYYIKKFKIGHMDFYRIKNVSDLYTINFFDYLNKNVSFLIEWGDSIRTNIKPNIKFYILNYLTQSERIIILKSQHLNLKKIFG